MLYENAQFTAETREQLEKVLQHFDHYHPEASGREVMDLVNVSAYDPEVRPGPLAPLARSIEDPPSPATELAIADSSP
jgi:hypothetical protein